MYHINFENPCHVYFIGIGGISMSGLAEVLMKEGFTVSGSDSKESPLTDHLSSLGAVIFYDQSISHIPQGTDVVVYTAAIHPEHPEIVDATKRNIPLLTRAELLGQLMRNYKTAINIAGTHGKTTTTSMVTEILLAANTDPTISVGGILPTIGGNIRVGGSNLFVTEACEYTNSFLSFYPTMEVILNIEADHLDFFKDIDDIRHSFRLFMEKLPKDGILVINGDIHNLSELINGLDCEIITVGHGESCDYRASNISYNEFAQASFDVTDASNTTLGHIQLSVPGEHNVYNALAAVALSKKLNLSMDAIVSGLLNFHGTQRRFEKKGVVNGITIIDDYAHHPQEITATLTAAKKYPHKKIWCIFQPHTYTRTKALLTDFAKALSLADEVVLAKIYPARETDDLGISSDNIRVLLEQAGTSAHYFETFEEIEKFILQHAASGDLVITMGAGDVVKIGEDLISK